MDQLLILLVLTSFCVELPAGASAQNHETEMYWQSVLPNAVMPKPLKALIPHGLAHGEGVVPNFNLAVHTKQLPGVAYTKLLPGVVYTKKQLPGVVYTKKQLPGVLYTKPLPGVVYTKKQLPGVVYTKQLPGVVYTKEADSAPRSSQGNEDNQTLFFFEKDLHEGMKMNLRFVNDKEATFLPRQVADSIPFTSNKLPEILKRLSIKPGSKEANLLSTTLTICEIPRIKGEHRYCATSLESMIDFSVSRLGKNAKALATELNGKGKDQTQSYALVRVSKAGDKSSVVCHKMTYAYAVYLCHEIPATKSYVVSLVGADGSRVKALAVCHVDTSAWDPDYEAFELLKVKPGTIPICHFLPKDAVVWVPN